MNQNSRRAEERLDIALDRIAAEKTARAGRLDLGNLGLTRPPPGLLELDWLEELILGGVRKEPWGIERRLDVGNWEKTDEAYNPNRIEPIASWLTGLSRLRSLDCSDTDLQDLAPLADLSNLQSLDCGWTQVADLPEAIIGLPDLENLIIGAQPGLGHIPAEVLSQRPGDNCLSRLRAHLADLDTGAELLRDLKVIVLGNGRIGKTQICRRLRGEGFEENADSTHGISVTSVELAMPAAEEDAVLNLWDFGGQDIYHGTHALFMQTRALFLLVWTPDSEQGDQAHGGLVFRNRPLPYWLEYIRHLGGDRSPVILVQNQCDGGLGECLNLPVADALPSPLLAAGRLCTRVPYSAKDDTGRPRLMDAPPCARPWGSCARSGIAPGSAATGSRFGNN